MKAHENIATRGPVIWEQYKQKLTELEIVFRFVEYGFQNLSVPKRRNFVKHLKSQDESKLAERMEMVRLKVPGISDEFLEEHQTRQRLKIKAAFRSRTHTQYAEWVSDGMTSAEVLFRVTVFEDFLKHVHASILRASPKILSASNSNSKRSIALKEIFSLPFEDFTDNQICHAVEQLDRQRMSQRIEYFAKYLGIDFASQGKYLIEISEIRNKIAHGNPLQALTQDYTTLPLKGIQGTISNKIKSAMQFAFEQGRSAYPRNFLDK
ncbi:MAG TPA: hypothetical protein VMR33_16320 [Candidatus Baltobacteraceae bacterium]|jgi:hypothetical protein|nr:hypothetical protein [Candidatus Baltobacteraceae bacterium]